MQVPDLSVFAAADANRAVKLRRFGSKLDARDGNVPGRKICGPCGFRGVVGIRELKPGGCLIESGGMRLFSEHGQTGNVELLLAFENTHADVARVEAPERNGLRAVHGAL